MLILYYIIIYQHFKCSKEVVEGVRRRCVVSKNVRLRQ